ncbi:uncharacterized protein DUF1080 [Marinoscillum furvescens DSM 4134]|uniref:Uncharacterized protein DUF1080 n=2 Tax=Marinoscillum furvescens TaxID=1026 RepID=A0A3D9KZY1_MARFU|nr:uncharacterized protein DUF1080 [Marinoscillum furvescens DSM 4134]
MLLICSIGELAISQSWEPLFNGKNLQGWESNGGAAKYHVADGSIVGITQPNTPNTFLCTKKNYGDFILELEVYLSDRVNSGIQFRSALKPASQTVYGYQCELDPSQRSWSGGIYDESRRGWLYPLSRNEPAKEAFLLSAWNTVRIECIGQEINTFVNGIHASRLVDDLSDEGFIGLQVHAIDREADAGKEIRWKNIRILTEDLEKYKTPLDPRVPEISYLKNELTEWERDHGFRLLWDGKTSNGWRGAKLEAFPESGWEIKDGVLTVLATDGGESTGPGDIVTTKMYSDFELELKFKISKGANSGIKYLVDPTLNKGAGSAIGCEFQILDDANHPDAKMGVKGNRTVGALYDLIAPKNLQTPWRKKSFNAEGWNTARIVSRDGNVTHWLNNELIVSYDRFSHMFEALVNYSKYKNWEQFGRWAEGSILLQDHGNEVSFHSIKIREF